MKYKKTKIALIVLFVFIVIFLIASKLITNHLLGIYERRQSVVIKDRNDQIIAIRPNLQDYYVTYTDSVPDQFKTMLLEKEDQYFYKHPGVNPLSILRAIYNYVSDGDQLASSTINQQLAKVLLSNEQNRSIKNKIIETIDAVALEIYLPKEKILTMYSNSIFFGNNVSGINEASYLYFNTPPNQLNDWQITQLLTSVNNPTYFNPFTENNFSKASGLAGFYNIDTSKIKKTTQQEIKLKKQNYQKLISSETDFELPSLKVRCFKNCNLTIDKELTHQIREFLYQDISALINKNAFNGAVVVIKIPENEVLAIVGSPKPELTESEYQINAAIKPRPIGSTVKPFIYEQAFAKGLRPYTKVEDKEYKYVIGSGFAFYPKNYDYQYRGEVNLHYALANSLNVPTVKVLEYVGIENFYEFLLKDLEFTPVQDIKNYQLGIALGGLEMDLLALSYYFTIFPNEGFLKELNIYKDYRSFPIQTGAYYSHNNFVAEKPYIQLVNKIISDRKTGVEQFGLKGALNLSYENYGVKTGTSREFHDSWTVGFTPDFLVGVWVGNLANTPTEEVSGASGAGIIWNKIMNLMYESEYNKNTPLDFDLIEEYYNETGSIEYGLKYDDYDEILNKLENKDLIITPHHQDIFLLEPDMQVPLRSRVPVSWYINDELIEKDIDEIIFVPNSNGVYKIKAVTNDNQQSIIEVIVDSEI